MYLARFMGDQASLKFQIPGVPSRRHTGWAKRTRTSSILASMRTRMWVFLRSSLLSAAFAKQLKNWTAHIRWTGPQIWKQLPEINLFCMAMGSAGQYSTAVRRFSWTKLSSIYRMYYGYRNLFEVAKAIGHSLRVSRFVFGTVFWGDQYWFHGCKSLFPSRRHNPRPANLAPGWEVWFPMEADSRCYRDCRFRGCPPIINVSFAGRSDLRTVFGNESQRTL